MSTSKKDFRISYNPEFLATFPAKMELQAIVIAIVVNLGWFYKFYFNGPSSIGFQSEGLLFDAFTLAIVLSTIVLIAWSTLGKIRISIENEYLVVRRSLFLLARVNRYSLSGVRSFGVDNAHDSLSSSKDFLSFLRGGTLQFVYENKWQNLGRGLDQENATQVVSALKKEIYAFYPQFFRAIDLSFEGQETDWQEPKASAAEWEQSFEQKEAEQKANEESATIERRNHIYGKLKFNFDKGLKVKILNRPNSVGLIFGFVALSFSTYIFSQFFFGFFPLLFEEGFSKLVSNATLVLFITFFCFLGPFWFIFIRQLILREIIHIQDGAIHYNSGARRIFIKRKVEIEKLIAVEVAPQELHSRGNYFKNTGTLGFRKADGSLYFGRRLSQNNMAYLLRALSQEPSLSHVVFEKLVLQETKDPEESSRENPPRYFKYRNP